MRKIYTTPKYKKRHKRRLIKFERKRRNKKRVPKIIRRKEREKPLSDYILKPTVYAPSDFRLIDNIEPCLSFFSKLRDRANLNDIRGELFIKMSLKNVSKIDYASISVLTAISDDYAYKKINLQGDFPDNVICKKHIIDSGFLEHVYDLSGRKFPKSSKSELIFFEKGGSYLSENDYIKISDLVSKVIIHLDGKDEHHLPITTTILEICGNSIEWSGTNNRLWLFGVSYENDKVVFTVTDVGNGILETLHIKFVSILSHLFKGKSNLEILKGAFIQKYGSTSRQVNRNKGLPSIKDRSDTGGIKNLKLVTNDVILYFDSTYPSRTFSNKMEFKGTFYQWELTKDCIYKIQPK